MKPIRIAEVLKQLITTRWPAFIWGPPGVGKSSTVHQVAKELKYDLIDIRASLLDPTDIRGIPAVVDGEARWCPPSFLPRDTAGAGILFFDELSAAPPLVQASLYQLTLDRRVGEYVLPEGWRIVAAGNRAEDASITFRMPAALSNRFVHLDFEVDLGNWMAWASGRGLHPLVMGFIGTRPELLFSMKKHERAFPTPRSWEIASDVIATYSSPEAAHDVLIGVVGEGAAHEFLGYCKMSINEEQIKEIIKRPESAKLPQSLGDQYALISYISSKCRDKAVAEAAAVLLARVKPELAVLMLRNLLHVDAKFALKPKARAFIAAHADVIA